MYQWKGRGSLILCYGVGVHDLVFYQSRSSLVFCWLVDVLVSKLQQQHSEAKTGTPIASALREKVVLYGNTRGREPP